VRVLRTSLHHPQDISSRDGLRRELPALVHAPKQRRFFLITNAARI
jgi:hypothetical protein